MGVERQRRQASKVCIVLTTRGNYAKFRRLLSIADFQTVIGGELLLSDRITGFFDLSPDFVAYFNIAGDTPIAMGKSVGAAVSEFCTAFSILKPSSVMIVGDRFEIHAVAIAAYITGIPIAHLEGGETSGSLDNNLRHAISALSGIHFPCTEMAGLSLMHKGFENIHVVGSTSIDIIAHTELKSAQDIMEIQELSGSGNAIDVSEPFILVVHHPDTSNPHMIKHETTELVKAIDSLHMPTIWMNSNLDAGENIIGSTLRRYRDEKRPDFIHFFKSLPIEYYGYLLKSTACIIGNSSSGVREACYTGTPNVLVGMRQQGRETGDNTISTPSDAQKITGCIRYQIKHGPYPVDFLYGDGTASEKILKVIA